MAYSPRPGDSPRGRSFERWLEVETWQQPGLKDVRPALGSIATACRQISTLVRRAHTEDLSGLATGAGGGAAVEVNVQGEEQKKLDVVTNNLLKTWLCASGTLFCVASEEEDEPCTCSQVIDHADFNGDLVAMFDPLDGSSNVDAGLATGTIFAILRHPEHLGGGAQQGKSGGASAATLLQPGSRLVAAGYCLYGAATTLVVSLGTGVHGFTLDADANAFILTMPDIRIPRRGRAVMFNHGNFGGWDLGVQQYVRDAQTDITRDRLLPPPPPPNEIAVAKAVRSESAAAADGIGDLEALLSALEVEKGVAAAEEDYERALALKKRIAELRTSCSPVRLDEDGHGEKAAPLSNLQQGSFASRAAANAAAGDSAGTPGRYFKYSGAFVADVHTLLTRGGGIFGYPADAKNRSGKLRLLYESNPMAFLVEQAGGVASTGLERILDVPPESVHQRIPTFLGSADDVFDLSCYMRYRLGPDMWI